MPRWSRYQRSHAWKRKLSSALEETLKAFADPVARQLKVRSALRAGGIETINHSRRALVRA